MVRHIVSWNFKPELDEAQRQSLREEVVPALLSLKDKIPCLRDIQAFCPPLDSSNCDLVLYSTVDEVSDLPLYQNHPDHRAVTPLIRDHFCDRRCCDIQG
ncbi:MAG: Dabb family protein [Lawsonibacter sp.]